MRMAWLCVALTGIAADLTKSLTRVGTAVFIISTWCVPLRLATLAACILGEINV